MSNSYVEVSIVVITLRYDDDWDDHFGDGDNDTV